jgi:hypothetical protein
MTAAGRCSRYFALENGHWRHTLGQNGFACSILGAVTRCRRLFTDWGMGCTL